MVFFFFFDKFDRYSVSAYVYRNDFWPITSPMAIVFGEKLKRQEAFRAGGLFIFYNI